MEVSLSCETLQDRLRSRNWVWLKILALAESIGLIQRSIVTEESSIVVVFKAVQSAATAELTVFSLYLGKAGEALEDKSKSD